ncbi:AraC family transcriptional regulator [Paraglaciecola polaris]|uniref:AraC family transcriptional regulator n=2 Tax=Paraglaciecola polaris TaxID=222814 RepID=UPI0002DF5CF8|nr:helix-turn-helix transcriptional regulator [Paraglaciecola polaris]|tara:strand:+ start:410 stop:1201 length:792 start_codon:yes stop_codon:yes gene_type:complete
MSLFNAIQWDDLQHFESMPQSVVARIERVHNSHELPLHTHPKGQLILALHGYVTCEVAGKMWMVPTHSAIWIPAHTTHSNRAYNNATLCHVFIQPSELRMPDHTCTLAITPLAKELICHFATLEQHYSVVSATHRMAQVLIDILTDMPQQPLDLPLSTHPTVSRLARQLFSQPGDRKTLSQWAAQLAMTERTLARLIKKETGMTFGRWRHQLHVIVAMQQLTNKMSVQSVSEHLGYNSVSAFITMFKGVLGQSPKRYTAQQHK